MQCKSEIEINEARLEQCHGKGVWLVECLSLEIWRAGSRRCDRGSQLQLVWVEFSQYQYKADRNQQNQHQSHYYKRQSIR
ncbi:uncharacterized protein LOC104001735 [Pan troglodytes]|uniref:uncharacterized protein LOC104001735 n=1 Tax=Pan troglodytes TaxID=9598 RepID=UPI00301406C3